MQSLTWCAVRGVRSCLFAAAASAATLAACRAEPAVESCTDDLVLGVSPAERTIRVGETFTADAGALGCGGRHRLTDSWTWRAADSAVVGVDSVSGAITGRAVGETTVSPTGRKYGRNGDVRVTVVR
jgi:hypothetical protein